MSIPGAFAHSPGDSADDSDASFNSGDLAHLEGIAQMDSDDDDGDHDPDFEPVLDDDDADFFIDDDDETEPDDGDEAPARDPDQNDDDDDDDHDEPQAGDDDDRRPQLRIGLNPVTRSVMLIGDDGVPRPLRATDLIGTGVSLGAIRNMLLRSLGRGGGALDGDEEDDDAIMGHDDEDDDERCAPFSLCSLKERPTS